MELFTILLLLEACVLTSALSLTDFNDLLTETLTLIFPEFLLKENALCWTSNVESNSKNIFII